MFNEIDMLTLKKLKIFTQWPQSECNYVQVLHPMNKMSNEDCRISFNKKYGNCNIS